MKFAFELNDESKSFLVLRLSARKNLTAREKEAQGRDWKGYDRNVSPEELCKVNSKEWRLGEKAKEQDAVMFVYSNKVVAMMTIDKIVQTKNHRWSIEGKPIRIGDPLYSKYVGKESPIENLSRNPVSYFTEEKKIIQEIAPIVSDAGGVQKLIKLLNRASQKGWLK